MYKVEAASWFRIYEMFHFQSFHMFGFIGSALIIGTIGIQWIKIKELNDIDGNKIKILPKEKAITQYLFGGIIFGFGWALVGACPGPMFVLLGAGFASILLVVFGAIIGTFFFGKFKKYLE